MPYFWFTGLLYFGMQDAILSVVAWCAVWLVAARTWAILLRYVNIMLSITDQIASAPKGAPVHLLSLEAAMWALARDADNQRSRPGVLT